jgi:hypothetical protein
MAAVKPSYYVIAAGTAMATTPILSILYLI